MPCLNCPSNASRRLPELELQKADLLIIVDSPTQTDIAKNCLLNDTGGRLIKEVLSQLNIASYQVTSTVLCLPPEKRTPNRKEIATCKERLLKQIKECSPKKILLLGSMSCIALFDKAQDRGKWLDFEGIPTIYTWAPGYLVGNQKNFSQWVNHIDKLNEDNITWEEYTWEYLSTEQSVVDYLLKCKEASRIALDYEATTLDPFGCKRSNRSIPLCATMSYDGKHAVFIPASLISGRVLNLYKLICETKEISGSNFADFDWKISYANYGIKTRYVNDTVIKNYLLDENAGENGLKQLAQLYLNAPDWEKPMLPWKKKMGECPLSLMAPYACCDAIATWRLDEYLDKELRKANLDTLYNTLLKQSIPILSGMSCHGVAIDTTKIELLGATLAKEIIEVKAAITDAIGYNIFGAKSVSSLKLGKYFYEDKKYPVVSVSSKTGRPTVDSKVRNALINRYDDPVAKLVNEFNDLDKLKATYVDGLEDRLDTDGRIHARFMLQITATGRLSGRDPNLQNIPKRKESGKVIRTLFVPDKGTTFFDSDYSNIEVRVGALESGDPILTEMFNNGIDVHRRVASMIYGVDEKDVTDLQRTYAKTGTFGVMYGMTHEGASYRLNLSKDDALLLVQGVKDIFRGLDEWSTYMCNFALENNYVVSRYGRIRRFPLIITTKDIESIKRKAVNTPIQSLASDICLNSMYHLKKNMGHLLVPQIIVHDSVCGSITTVNDEVVNQMKSIMTKLPFESKVRFDVDCAFGPNWGKVEKYVYQSN